jgi:hypothetical protein
MPKFQDIAAPLIAMGIPITPVRPDTKAAFIPDFPTTASTDPTKIKEWNKMYPDFNAACVARAEDGGVWFWEVDSPDVLQRIAKETGHDVAAEVQTFKVRSRPGRGHFYFRHNERSKTLGNISQTYVLGQDWSVRTHHQYVVAPGSIHMDTGLPYVALNPGTSLSEAPDWLLDWLVSQKIQKMSAVQGTSGTDTPRNERGLVPHGAIHGYMLTQAGKLRQMGLDQPEIEVALLKLVHDNCEAPIDDSKVVQMSRSICNFKPGESKALLLTGSTAAGAAVAGTDAGPYETPEEINFETIEYPLFPKWVMTGTSIYENFVKPYCAANSRIDYFMWMPTAALMMNYLGTKVSVPLKGWKSSLYLVLIGEKGRAHKSASIKDGMKYLEYAGVLNMYSKEIKNADGKTIVWEAGSPEGLGTDMQRTNCKNAVLFYDELSALVAKASIEGSGMNSALLKMYESNNFSNSIKSKKDAFTVTPDSYVATVITATTDKKFTEQWSKLAGEDTGLDDRFTFVYQPETMPERKIQETVSFHEAAQATRVLIDKAVNQKNFSFFDQTPFKVAQEKYDTRALIRAEKWALYFAIDQGLTEIDEECVEKGIALARYESEVKKYLMTYEAKNDESSIQQGIIRLLKKSRGRVEYRDLERKLSSNKYGTTIWNRAYNGLVSSGYITQEGRGVKGSPVVIRLLRDMRFSDED